ncbi:GNAT family N-acetyltransferase [Streptomyces sp. LE64]|uniref:GNAT family N-acetyltransferase n=1 Tax=Streptomyces sp. LE64 TaxID=3448653 RepID=UPI0040435A82
MDRTNGAGGATANENESAGPTLGGAGLLLRPWNPQDPGDVDAWLRGLTDPEFLRWNTPMIMVRDRADAHRSLAARAEQVERGAVASFCVTDEEDGTVLGHMGLSNINPALRVAIVGYWTLPEARGRGVAGRALALVSAWAFRERGLHRLELGHAPEHEVSCRIAERTGFRAEGTLRGAMFEAERHDAFRDVHLHGRLATDPYPALG